MLITVDTPGQLGNRLQLFANILAYALEYNHSLVVLSFSEYAHLFEGSSNGIYDFGKIKVIVPKQKQSLIYSKFLRGSESFKQNLLACQIIKNNRN